LERLVKFSKQLQEKSTEEVKDLVIDLIQDKKGKDIVCLDLQKITEAVTDYFIICHGDSSTQVKAIIDYIEDEMSKLFGMKRVLVEGKINGEWALVDLGDIVIHVFNKEKRDFYMLEELWSDAVITRYEND
jgi:ribosome-associated protein